MKTTIDLPEALLRRAKVEAALRGRKLRELVAEGLQMRLDMKEGPKATGGTPEPLLRNFDDLPLIQGQAGSPQLKVSSQRIHYREMEAELERHAASLR